MSVHSRSWIEVIGDWLPSWPKKHNRHTAQVLGAEGDSNIQFVVPPEEGQRSIASAPGNLNTYRVKATHASNVHHSQQAMVEDKLYDTCNELDVDSDEECIDRVDAHYYARPSRHNHMSNNMRQRSPVDKSTPKQRYVSDKPSYKSNSRQPSMRRTVRYMPEYDEEFEDDYLPEVREPRRKVRQSKSARDFRHMPEYTDDDYLREVREPTVNIKQSMSHRGVNRVSHIPEQDDEYYEYDNDTREGRLPSQIQKCQAENTQYRPANVNVHPSRKQREPDKFDGKTLEWPDYYKHFETVAVWNGWSDSEKAMQLIMSLRGEALRILSDITPGAESNYIALVDELNRTYNPAERQTAWKLEFRNRMRKTNESVTEYALALKRLASKAFCNMASDVLEQWVMDQFGIGLGNLELRRHVQFGHPRTLNEAISLAVEYEAFEPSSGDRVRKPNVGPMGGVCSMSKENTESKQLQNLRNEVAAMSKTIQTLQNTQARNHVQNIQSRSIPTRASQNWDRNPNARFERNRTSQYHNEGSRFSQGN